MRRLQAGRWRIGGCAAGWLAAALLAAASAAQAWERTAAGIEMQRGDSLWEVADAVLGDGNRYLQLVAECPPDPPVRNLDNVPVGTVLRCPPKAEPAAEPGEPAPEQATPERPKPAAEAAPPPAPGETAQELAAGFRTVAEEIGGMRADLNEIFCRPDAGGVLPAGCAEADAPGAMPGFLRPAKTLGDDISADLREIRRSLSEQMSETLEGIRESVSKSEPDPLGLRFLLWLLNQMALPILTGAVAGFVLTLLTARTGVRG